MDINEVINGDIEDLYEQIFQGCVDYPSDTDSKENRKEREEKAEKIAETYGLTHIELEQLIDDMKSSLYEYRIISGEYDDTSYYQYRSKSEVRENRKKIENKIRESLKKYILRKKIHEIKPEEITPEFIEILKANGYDWKEGSVVHTNIGSYLNADMSEEKETLNKIIHSKFDLLANEKNGETEDREKQKLAKEYGVSVNEIEQLIEDKKSVSFLEMQMNRDYNNGDIYYDDSHLEQMAAEKNNDISKKVEKLILRKRICQIKPEEITPNLIETLRQQGYDGSFGNPILSSYFKMYCITKGCEEKSTADKEKIIELENKFLQNEHYIDAGREYDTKLEEIIDTQESHTKNIIKRANDIKGQTNQLQKVENVSFIKKIARIFSGEKRKKREMQADRVRIIEQLNDESINECSEIENLQFQIGFKVQLRPVRKENSKSEIKDSVYNSITSPVENNKDLVELLDLFLKLREQNRLDLFYRSIVQDEKEISSADKKQYDEKFFKFVVQPAAEELENKIKNGQYMGFSGGFVPLYSAEEMKEIFNGKNADEVISRGRRIESKNPEVFDYIRTLYSKNGGKDRKQLYANYLEQSNVYLSEEELSDWLKYRAVMEEFEVPNLMGFSMGEEIADSKMDISIDAGTDTYELAQLFRNECKQYGLDPSMMVAIGNSQFELSRKGKLKIYIKDIKDFEKYNEILQKIKAERPDFNFGEPAKTMGAIDNWIGVGSIFPIDGRSVNADMCGTIVESFNAYFDNFINENGISREIRQKILEDINKNPHILDDIRKVISNICEQKGMSPEKLCIRQEFVTNIKAMKLVNKEAKPIDNKEVKSIDAIVGREITAEEITPQLMEMLRINNYDGKSGSPLIQTYFQLHCKYQDEMQRRQADKNKIAEFEEKVTKQEIEIKAINSRRDLMENIVRRYKSATKKMRDYFNRSHSVIVHMRDGIQPMSLREKIFGRRKGMPLDEGFKEISENSSMVLQEHNELSAYVQTNKPYDINNTIKIVEESTRVSNERYANPTQHGIQL